MSAKPIYEFDKVTVSSNAVPSALQGSVYWYDTDTTLNAESVYYESTDTYAYWNDGSDWLITVVADVDTTPTDKFTLSGSTFTGAGAFSGTLTLSENTIVEAWNKAERAVLTSLIEFTGCTEGVNAFRGRYDTNKEGNPKYRNIWMINSGGAGGAYDPERTYGTDGSWCNVLMDGEIRGLFETRVMAMNFASSVLAWLKHTNNMNETSGTNVTWCMLTDLPQQPEGVVVVNRLNWEVVIPIQILYLTEGEY